MFNPILGILASSGAVAGGSYESIATTTVGSGGSSTITFSSIPSTYKHLQIRGIARASSGTYQSDLNIKINSDTGSNYTLHRLYGDGSTVAAAAATSQTVAAAGRNAIASASSTASAFSGIVCDILDYGNTNKYKTIRTLGGYDNNTSSSGQSQILFSSDLWLSTSAITQLDLTLDSGNFAQYSSFALYGIKA